MVLCGYSPSTDTRDQELTGEHVNPMGPLCSSLYPGQPACRHSILGIEQIPGLRLNPGIGERVKEQRAETRVHHFPIPLF